MRFYRVNSAFPYLVATQAQAKGDARRFKCQWEAHDVPTDKDGLMAYLNGQERLSALDDAAVTPTVAPPACLMSAQTELPSYAHQSVAIDEAWEKLPLGQKLHYAALAMEDAREAL